MTGKSGHVDKLKSCKTTYEWKIEGFDRELLRERIHLTDDPYEFDPTPMYRHRLRKKLVSPLFMAGENVGIKSLWHVEIEDNSGERMFEGELMEIAELKVTLIFANCIGTGDENVTPFSCHAKLSILHPQSFVLMRKFTPERKVIDVQTNGEKHEFAISHLGIYQCIVKKTVCISIELEIFGNDFIVEISDPSGSSVNDGRDFGITNLQRDFEKLLVDQDSSDFTIECDGKIFKVHKTILRARSSVFATMLNNQDFKECQTNSLVVEDIDKTSMEILLHYIYTGKVLTELMKNFNVLEPVIRGADKYDLSELKNHCFHQLAQSITVENFGPLAILASAIRPEQKEMTILKDYYLRNVLSLMKNAEFRKLAVQLPDGIFED